MIEIKNVSFRHENADEGSIHDITLTIPDGQCVLLCGESGSGKTTITRLINGLIPHYYEGEMHGEVIANGLNVTKSELYETAKKVGSVFQNPRSQFFCVDTTSELAFGCENMGLPEADILSRIDKVTAEMNIKSLMGQNIFELSGGEKQKIACGSVSALQPEIMVLDEPTSNLDLNAIEELKETVQKWKQSGKTIIIAEHRLYWLREICDRVICTQNGRIEFDMTMEEFKSLSDEERNAYGLRPLFAENAVQTVGNFSGTDILTLNNFSFSYDKKEVLNIPKLEIPVGSIVAVTGHNGAGKSTFSRCLCGLEKRFKGTVLLNGETLKSRQLLKKCYMVMQDVNHQLFCETVEEEVQLGMNEENAGKVQKILEELDLDGFAQRHPMSLSGGQKQRTAIASAMLADKEILLFDEPTSGLDFKHMEQTAKLLSSLKNKKTVFVATHDPELISRCCTHILRIENGVIDEFTSR
ncbi:MAG: energy-coupling factor ABC transporter ATP-binding protein [Oscillospiraceae bacterium]|nr:energy-coupling factor ABC transporter ATP-binding protein [Oscillospiraceae bacterium]